MGGFAAFGGFLAEDAVMGRRFAEAGLRVATSFVPVENRNVVGTIARSFERHSRWAKMRRALSPAFFTIEPVFSPMLVALAAALVVPGRVTGAVLAASILLQTSTALTAMWTVRGRPLSWRYAPLEVVRVLFMFACWLSACTSRTVSWRGNALGVGRGTALTPLLASATEGEGATARAA
jgi:ceramide glucosyltransferase